MKSLKAQHNPIAESSYELEILNGIELTSFREKMDQIGLFPLKPVDLKIFQINMGKMCNQVCKHCHVDAGPDRKEIMTRETLEYCLDIIRQNSFHTVDLTGGAPEMNPNFRWFVESVRKIDPNCTIIVRCNLTIILANPKFHDLPDFFKNNKVEVVSSLPYFTAMKTDSQRGEGVFEKSIKALKMLNEVGYGDASSGLILNLVYNPSGAFLPASQGELEVEFKKKLRDRCGIVFNSLFTITNLPISRFLEYLIRSENFDAYMEKLVDSFNPSAAMGVMCRDTISVGWDGYLYDCDFNQMLDLKVDSVNSVHVKDWNGKALAQRNIVLGNHCYGCTAGAGSSCGGATA
ncbi:arsenosugar biosynthesis radical SAM (seleno)protein ArsS [Algoriphagus sp. CAU 1675]|uniref:arsenosugar biosynthesis radical SAM (seleno)protein ArsS n=1 Tax=Algoriphagus sp. CAU 1675 TaxID=3032597 RepID=UPI0023DB37D3|nr:arsenosugar biosynthesis radical SAM (seleno)protein ArsS [Algoriphagus sp. CAU 1675]MDF2158004.1 arsenosugar biosynthesis radical SAM protein ArsS [Algoriphagus sp. CAU 1675]